MSRNSRSLDAVKRHRGFKGSDYPRFHCVTSRLLADPRDRAIRCMALRLYTRAIAPYPHYFLIHDGHHYINHLRYLFAHLPLSRPPG